MRKRRQKEVWVVYSGDVTTVWFGIWTQIYVCLNHATMLIFTGVYTVFGVVAKTSYQWKTLLLNYSAIWEGQHN